MEKLLEYGIDERAVKNMNFEKVAWEWYEVYSKTGVKENTLRIRRVEINTILKHFAKVNIDKITSRMYQKMLNDMHEKGYEIKDKNGKIIYKPYKRNTISGVHTPANMIFKYAIKHKMRKDNPCEGAVIPQKALTVDELEKESIEETYMEREELEEFLSVVNEHGLHLDKEWFYLLAFTSMRTGEMLALKWSDINFDTKEIRITKTLYNPRDNMHEYKLTPPKTKAGIRTIHADDIVIEILKSHKAKQNKIVMVKRIIPDGQGGTMKNPDYHDGDFVFAHTNGYPYTQVNVYRRMKRLMKKTNINKQLTPHSLRHTHISLLTEAGVDLPTIMKRVGHDDEETTRRIYTHVTEKMEENANEKMRVHFDKILSNLSN